MFVVFEGIDGSGKTTLSNLVAAALQARGLPVRHIRAEGKYVSTVSEAIRNLGRDARNLDLVPQAELLLYVARDVQLIEQVVRPSLRQGDIVIADRFLYTAEVLGRNGRHLPSAYTAPILAAAAGDIVPDLVVLCDVDPALARARRKAAKLAAADRRPPARKGLAGVGLQHRLRRGYLDLAAASPERWAVVDNDGRLDETVALVTELVDAAQRGAVSRSLDRFRGEAEIRRARQPARRPQTSADALAIFLARVDAYAEHEPRVAAHLLGGMSGPAVDERRRALALRVPEAVLAGLTGLDDAASWSLRRTLQPDHPGAVAATLLGLASDNLRAEALRLALEDVAPTEVAMSLESVDGAEASAMRTRLFARAPDAVMASLARLASADAWSLRARWLTRHHGTLADSYPAALAAAVSVTGLDDDRAWSIREQVQPAAPVAALASLEGVLTSTAWRWRETHLPRAPKVVMATLTGVRHDKAWPMRNAVAVDCKEALDSIVGLDDPEAWALRETHADDWPSTTVKSLGPLAQAGRGAALIARQLKFHGDSLSLLKHTAAATLHAPTSRLAD
jgi:dTMP kinase